MKFPTLFQNRNFVLLYLGRLVSDFGNVFYNFAIGWYVLSLTGSSGQAGLYMSFGAIIFFILTPFAGVLADRWNRVKIVYLTDFIRGSTILLTGLLIMTNVSFSFEWGGIPYVLNFADTSLKLTILYINAFIFSVNGALFAPAISSLMPFIVKQDELQQGNSLFSAMGSIVNIIGSLSGAILYSLFGVGWIFVMTGISYVLSAISETFITTHTKSTHDTPLSLKSTFVDLGKGFKFLFGNKALARFAMVAVIINFVAAPLFAIGTPYLYNQILQVEPVYFSSIGVAASVGSIVMSIIFSMLKQKEKVYTYLRNGVTMWVPMLLIQSVLVWSVVNGHIPFIWYFGISLGLAVIDGLIGVFVNTPINVAFQKYVPREMLGRVNSMLNTVVSGLMPISVALGGLFLDYRPVYELYWVATVGFLIAVVILWRSKAIREF